MKTKKYSVMMKAAVAVVISILFSNVALAQFDVTAGTTVQAPISEERTGGTSTYTASGVHVAGDRFTWEIWGDAAPLAITSGGVDIIDGGSGTSADPYVVNITVDLSSIDVQWDTDATGITNTNGNVSVQKFLPVAASGCASPIQSWDIDFWSAASASFPVTTGEICSGEAIGGTVTIDLTGAPDGTLDGFAVDYSIVAPNLEDGTGTSWDGNTGTVTSDGATVTIALPDLLTNLTASDATFTITLDRMNDDFSGDGTIVNATYAITVHATPSTGTITSTGSLTRR